MTSKRKQQSLGKTNNLPEYTRTCLRRYRIQEGSATAYQLTGRTPSVGRVHDDVTDTVEEGEAPSGNEEKKDARNCTCATYKERSFTSDEEGRIEDICCSVVVALM